MNTLTEFANEENPESLAVGNACDISSEVSEFMNASPDANPVIWRNFLRLNSLICTTSCSCSTSRPEVSQYIYAQHLSFYEICPACALQENTQLLPEQEKPLP